MKPEVQPLKEAPQRVSPKVQKVLDAIEDVKIEGGIVKPNTLKPNQELNMRIEHNGIKLDLRLETHPLPLNYGGDYVTPMRHLNIQMTPPPVPPLPNNGHVILPPLK